MNLYEVCCGPCEDAGLCCQETSCCLECHFSLEENVALQYVPAHLGAEVRRQHAELQRQGFPADKVRAHAEWEMKIFERYCPECVLQQLREDHEAYDSGELHLQPHPEIKPRAIAVGAVNPQANGFATPGKKRQMSTVYPYPRRTRSVLTGVNAPLLSPARVPNGLPDAGPLPSQDDRNRANCTWWCNNFPNSQYCQPGSICHGYTDKPGPKPKPEPDARPGSGRCLTYDAQGNCIRRPQSSLRTAPRGMPRRGSRAVFRY